MGAVVSWRAAVFSLHLAWRHAQSQCADTLSLTHLYTISDISNLKEVKRNTYLIRDGYFFSVTKAQRNGSGGRKEYCWAITQSAGRSCCSASGSCVLGFGVSYALHIYVCVCVCVCVCVSCAAIELQNAPNGLQQKIFWHKNGRENKN